MIYLFILPLLSLVHNQSIFTLQGYNLELGKSIERELAGSQAHSYQIALTAGSYVKVVVEQQGIDVMAQFYTPDRKQLREYESEYGTQMLESIYWVAESDGIYRLNIVAKYQNAPAGRYRIRVAELRGATEREAALHEAGKLYTKYDLLFRAGQNDEAQAVIERVLEIRERVLGPEHPSVASALNGLATIYYTKAEISKVEPLLLRSLSIREKALGPDHPSVAVVLTNLGFFYKNLDDYAKALPSLQRALEIKEKAFGPDHPEVARALRNLALIYLDRAEPAKAQTILQRVLAICKKSAALEIDFVAEILKNLALTYAIAGDLEQSLSLSQQALEIVEKTVGSDHPSLILYLSGIASIYRRRSEYAKAEPLYQRALELGKKWLGPDNPRVATLLSNLADNYGQKGEYAMAETLYQQALKIWENTELPNLAQTLKTLNKLAEIYREQRKDEKAEPLFQRALSLSEKTLGEENPSVSANLLVLALLYTARGETARALPYLIRAAEIEERNLIFTLSLGAEGQKLAYLEQLYAGLNFILTFQSQKAPNDAAALRLALTTLLRRKARGLDVMVDPIASFRRHAAPEELELLNQLLQARSQLATGALNGPDVAKVEIKRKRLDQLRSEVDGLERDLSFRSASFRRLVEPVTLAAVQAAIPPGSALVEFACFTPEDGSKSERPPRYLAYLLTAQGPPKWVDLGEAATIDRAVEGWRKALQEPGRPDRILARALDELIMRPVRRLLSATATNSLLIAPDGALNLIPFAALVDEQNKYLLERYSISYLASGRDLLRLKASAPAEGPPLIVADPDFGRPAALFQPLPATEKEAAAIGAILPNAAILRQAEATEKALKQAKRPEILHIATHSFFFDHKMSPDEVEAASTRGIAYTVQVGAAPTRETAQAKIEELAARDLEAYLIKSEVKNKGTFYRVRLGKFGSTAEAQKYGAELKSKSVVDEYFVVRYEAPEATGDAAAINLDPLGEPISGRRLSIFAARIKDPLERSGLALANANKAKSDGEDDGILTALEAAELDLLGTKLAVLSGSSEVKSGEGVQGLRRALVVAGTESQVISLWAASDPATKDLMSRYYQALARGEGRSEALRQVQLQILRERKGREHPFYWAAFVLSGEAR